MEAYDVPPLQLSGKRQTGMRLGCRVALTAFSMRRTKHGKPGKGVHRQSPYSVPFDYQSSSWPNSEFVIPRGTEMAWLVNVHYTTRWAQQILQEQEDEVKCLTPTTTLPFLSAL